MFQNESGITLRPLAPDALRAGNVEELLGNLNKLGVKLRLEGDDLRVSAPSGVLTEEVRQTLRSKKDQVVNMLRFSDAPAPAAPATRLQADVANRWEPFPLTDIQHAYWVGRNNAMEGSVATHLYVELDCENLDLARLTNALNRLIDRHEMLRAVIETDGRQRILQFVPRYEIAVRDVSALSQEEADQAIRSTRETLSQQVLSPDTWPLFDVRATIVSASRLRLHVNLDLLVVDAWSIFLFFKEWSQLYENPDVTLPGVRISFRDYVIAGEQRQNSDAYRKSQSYWMDRIPALPGPPDLPLRSDAAARQSPSFTRRESRLKKERWQKLKAAARDRGLTPSGLLLALYSEVLARWSSSPRFSVVVTIGERRPLHPDVPNLFGDFTSLLLHEVNCGGSQAFVDFARALQKQFMTDLDHREMSGVAVMREWAKLHSRPMQATMPFVFSSGLIWQGGQEPGDLEQLGKKVYSVSQTSQVWLDHHVMELQGDLVFIWDAADAVFEDGVLDAMFRTYCDLIEYLADDPSVWSKCDLPALPALMQQKREDANNTIDSLAGRRLHHNFVTRALENPNAIALISAGRTITYGTLLSESAAIADWLIARQVLPGQPVAIVMHKGWEQIAAVYGVLLAGAAYMPIDADLPARRQAELLQIGEVRHVLTQPGALRDDAVTPAYEVLEIRPGMKGDFSAVHDRLRNGPLNELAYIIFTSGTTGTPKGVMIDHLGAMNTIAHVNRLFHVGSEDRVLGVSSLSFDLSVYDIFGIHDAGGTLILPDAQKGHDAVHWRQLIQTHGVTLWNSAPQLMRMLMDSFYGAEEDVASLRTVLLSGDFIPLDLPDRIRMRSPRAQVISLGGATEASIWSNYYAVRAVDPAWASIPYGRALPNQQIWVYDHAFRPCPDHVKGRIYLGGVGLAIGYWRDPDKTKARFIQHPETGQRLYNTGDLGRYSPDGNVIILGRDDGQVKIRGHRVELGEIEAVLRQHPDIRYAVVVATAFSGDQRQIVAYIEAVNGSTLLDAASAREFVADRLPEYMVPKEIVVMDRIPVSANGKIDYKALPAVIPHADVQSAAVPPRTETERVILEAWSRVFPGIEIGVTDNFFELGGDSIVATQLVRELATTMPIQLQMHELFENLTIESLAGLFDSRAGMSDGGVSHSDHMVGDDVLLEEVRAAVERLDAIDFHSGPKVIEPKAILVTGATGWVGVHLLAELLQTTEATIYCLVRAINAEEGHARLLDALHSHELNVDASCLNRIEPICGDLAEPRFGLSETEWQALSAHVDSIYHLGASVNVLADYATHRRNNVAPLDSVLSLAFAHHLKPVFVVSPLTVSRRHIDGRLVVFEKECVHNDPAGLMTGYAQSKWAAEQILTAAMERGLPVRIFRTSHALPSARTGIAKPHDTYGAILKVACQADAVPDWADSRVHGVPVDILARLIVTSSRSSDSYCGVVHLENRDPLDLPTLLEALLQGRQKDDGNATRLPLETWKECCLDAASTLPGGDAMLTRVLFANRGNGTPVENMFSKCAFAKDYFERRGEATQLSNLTPPEYWRTVANHAGW